jgi:NADH:ubiquinone oxidoreductase subunit H
MTPLKKIRPSFLFILFGWSSNSTLSLIKSFRMARYSREGPGVLEFYEMVMVEPMLSYCQFVWMSKPYAHMVLFYSDLYRSTTLSIVHMTTLTRYAVKPLESSFPGHSSQDEGDWRSS